jgi:hypothetical protein
MLKIKKLSKNTNNNEYICLNCSSNTEELHKIIHNHIVLLTFLAVKLKNPSCTCPEEVKAMLLKVDPTVFKD